MLKEGLSQCRSRLLYAGGLEVSMAPLISSLLSLWCCCYESLPYSAFRRDWWVYKVLLSDVSATMKMK